MFSILDTGAGAAAARKTGAERACDQCKVRKVKCDMAEPCLPCSKKALNCTYQRMRKKRGPTGKRIESIRRQQNSELALEDDEYIGSNPASLDTKEPMDYEPFQAAMSTTSGPDLTKNAEIEPRYGPWENHSSQTDSMLPISIDPGLMSHAQDLASPPPAQIANVLDQTFSSDSTAASLTQNEILFPSLPVESPSGASEVFGAMLPQLTDSFQATQERWPQAVNEGTILHWIDVYFKRLHPIMPILSRTNMYREMLLRKHHTDYQYGSMLLSLCAFSMTQPVEIHEVAEAPSRATQARMLIEECIKMRATADFGEFPTLEMILTSFFLFACLFGNGQHGAAWHRLREAVDLATSLGIHRSHSYEPLDSMTREKWLRTYLVLCVTERAYALQQGRPIGFRGQIGFNARFLQTSVSSKGTDTTGLFSHLLSHEPSDTPAITGLIFLAETFSAFDEGIIECWNGQCKLSDGMCESFDRRRALQIFQAQRRVRETCLAGNTFIFATSQHLTLSELAEPQQADISVTHFWLLNRLWSLCLSHSLLRSTSAHPELRHDFAIYVAKALWATCKTLPFAAMEVHGVGLAEKIYDITLSTITAVRLDAALNLETDLTRTDEDQTPIDIFMLDDEVRDVGTLLQSLAALLNNFRGGDHHYGTQLEAALRSIDR